PLCDLLLRPGHVPARPELLGGLPAAPLQDAPRSPAGEWIVDEQRRDRQPRLQHFNGGTGADGPVPLPPHLSTPHRNRKRQEEVSFGVRQFTPAFERRGPPTERPPPVSRKKPCHPGACHFFSAGTGFSLSLFAFFSFIPPQPRHKNVR